MINRLDKQERTLLDFYNKDESIAFFDIGAHYGDSTLRYKSIFTKASAYCFEPVPENYTHLIELTNSLSDVKCFNIALSDVNGDAVFYVSDADGQVKGSKSSSLLQPTENISKVTPWLKFENQIKTKTKTLSSFCEENDINAIEFLHMDVQGAELRVLNGAEDMIKNINIIWLEVGNVELYRGQPLKEDIQAFMITHGFIKLIDDVNWVSGDQLWVKKSFLLLKQSKLYLLKHQFKNSVRNMYYLFRKVLSIILKKLK